MKGLNGCGEKTLMDNRTRNVISNISLSFLWKGLSVVLSFFVVPLTVHYLDVVEYGVWITMFTVLNWINMLDVGIGLGMRNKLAEAVSLNDVEAQKKYISTGFYTFALIGLLAIICLLAGAQFIKMQKIFNTTMISEEKLYYAFLLTGLIVVLSFVLSVLNNLFYAYQMAHYSGIINIIHNGFMLFFLLGLGYFQQKNFIYFIVAYGVAMILSKVVLTTMFFWEKKELLPSVRCYDRSLLRNICNLGVQFFIIQIACIFLFSSSNILISQCLGVKYVREYDLVFKVFSVITMLHSMVSAPLWNAYTDAYIQNDVVWIKKTLKKMMLLMIPLMMGTGILVFAIKPLMFIWLQQEFVLNQLLIIGMGVFVTISCWNNVFVMFLNGISVVKMQMLFSIFSTILVVPLAIYFMSIYHVAGMIWAIDVALSIGTISFGILCFKVINRMEEGMVNA
ncbi:MAG: hypothetical protein MJ048_00260 [Acidaminococcaceae bacterium]|nr:hypothetical protein [Acidaminococcaceae bacterium]